MAGMGTVGFLDDYLKIRHRRSLGLNKTAKLVGQTVVGVSFAVLAINFPDSRDVTPASTFVSYVRDIAPLALGAAAFVILALLFIAGFSNAVNLTDGLDGLAAGASAMVFASYVFISFWQFTHDCANELIDGCYLVRDPLDVTLVAAAGLGACLGFLWWNTSPAWIFMGDTGSLALGGLLSGLAIVTRTELLLIVLGGLFVAVTLSVVIQVAFFRATRRRVFRMAPLHHHFELAGWTETTVIVRFWLVTGDGRRLRARAVLCRLARLRRPVSAAPSWSPAWASPAPRPPGSCWPGARVLLTDAAEPPVAEDLTAAGATWLGRVDTPARRRRPGGHLARAGAPTTPCSPTPPAGAWRSSVSRSWRGGCASAPPTASPPPGWRSRAPTARRRRSRCSSRSCWPPGVGRSPRATSAGR